MGSFTLVCLLTLPAVFAWVRPDGVGRLPALGWNSWNAYSCDINAQKLLEAANAMVDKGFKDAGYVYVNCDDCWSNHNGRSNITNELLPNMTKFPDGIEGVADKVHDMGLKFGIYSSAGTLTCGGYPASLGYEKIDAKTFASWGVDYLKYDNCYVPTYWTDDCYACLPDTGHGQDFVNGTCTKHSNEFRLCNHKWPIDGINHTASYTALRYRIMQDALAEQNRTILYSLCDWGTNDVWTWGNHTANSWRMSDDITPDWPRIVEILNLNSFLTNWADFWGHNDPDMLEIGNGLTVQQSRSHFAFWAIMKSPLLIGTDLTKLSQTDIDILQNQYLLAFNQDPVYGKPAQPYKWGINPDWTFNKTNPAEFWSGSYTGGTLVAMLNTLNAARTMTAEFDEIPQLTANAYQVTNAWTGKSMGCKSGSVSMHLQAHDTAVLVLKDSCDG